MAQEVKIAGAVFSDVPEISVPDSQDNYHPFMDVSDTTATAGDVATGKYFYAANGTRTAGEYSYELPTMNASTKGGAKLGSGLDVTNDVLSVDITPSDIGAANVTHTHAASDVASGEIPIAHGGTGAATASGARSNLSVLEYSSGAFNVGGVSAYLLFTTTAIANFTPPTGVSSCMVLDTSDYGLYWFTS